AARSTTRGKKYFTLSSYWTGHSRQLFLTNKITTAAWPYLGRVNGPRGHIAAFASFKRAAFSTHRQSHFTIENDMRSFGGVRMIRVVCLRAILPDISVHNPFRMQLIFELGNVHRDCSLSCGENSFAATLVTRLRGTNR